MRYMRRFLPAPAPRSPLLPRGSDEPPGTRLAALRGVAAQTGWGAGIAATAALVGAVSVEEDARIAVVAAPLVAAALALAGYAPVAYGDPPPGRPLPSVPFVWGAGTVPPPFGQFDAVAVDATATPLAVAWLGGVLPLLARRSRRTRIAVLCRIADATAYRPCLPTGGTLTCPADGVALLHSA